MRTAVVFTTKSKIRNIELYIYVYIYKYINADRHFK